MKKIKWTDKKRFVPHVGVLEQDDIVVIPDDLARSLIKQGQAKIVPEKNKKRKIKET
jgi:hypothetical protein